MLDAFIRHPFMSRAGAAALTPRAFVEAMCRVERALARVQERAGLLPAGTSAAIETQLKVDAFDLDRLGTETADGGNVAIPFVKQAKALLADELRDYFHVGATSQDILDTALMLVLRPRLEAILVRLGESRRNGVALMHRHAQTPMIGRTLMQQAMPITFGAKVAQWLWGLAQSEKRLGEIKAHGLFVQFGGPVGVHTGLADNGPSLMDALADELGLTRAILPWHTDRQPILALADALGAVAIAAEKIALDVALMAQTEIGELSEPAGTGAGGSSSMPHKRNSVGCARIRAAARQIHANVAMLHNVGAQPMERGLGEWHAEWAPLVDSVVLAEGALDTLSVLLRDLNVHADAMRHNLKLTGSAFLARPAVVVLSQHMGPERAEHLVNDAIRQATTGPRELADTLLDQPDVAGAVDAGMLRAVLDPLANTGASQALVERVGRALAAM